MFISLVCYTVNCNISFVMSYICVDDSYQWIDQDFRGVYRAIQPVAIWSGQGIFIVCTIYMYYIYICTMYIYASMFYLSLV